MVTPNDPTLVVSSKPCQSAQARKTSEHAQCICAIYIYIYIVYHTHPMSDILFIVNNIIINANEE